jgi:hypothetical protein
VVTVVFACIHNAGRSPIRRAPARSRRARSRLIAFISFTGETKGDVQNADKPMLRAGVM